MLDATDYFLMFRGTVFLSLSLCTLTVFVFSETVNYDVGVCIGGYY